MKVTHKLQDIKRTNPMNGMFTMNLPISTKLNRPQKAVAPSDSHCYEKTNKLKRQHSHSVQGSEHSTQANSSNCARSDVDNIEFDHLLLEDNENTKTDVNQREKGAKRSYDDMMMEYLHENRNEQENQFIRSQSVNNNMKAGAYPQRKRSMCGFEKIEKLVKSCGSDGSFIGDGMGGVLREINNDVGRDNMCVSRFLNFN